MMQPARFRFSIQESATVDDPELEEASTAAHAEAREMMKRADNILATGAPLPKGLRDQIRGLRSTLRKVLPVWKDMKGDDDPDDEDPPGDKPVAEAATVEEFVALEEATPDRGGLIPVRIIAPGWGSTGHYSPETLKRAAREKAFPKGLQMFWDHPTLTERKERPERSVKDLAATLQEDATWMDHGPVGPGLYSKLKATTKSYGEAIRDLAPSIGVSIRADGQGRRGDAEGKTGLLIERIIPGSARSVDFVTAAGAGGKILELFESAAQGSYQHTEEDDMGELEEARRQLEEATTARTTAEARVAELTRDLEEARSRLLLQEARDLAIDPLTKSTLPGAARMRALERVRPVVKDGALDKDATLTSVQEAIKAEADYLKSIGVRLTEQKPDGRPSGMGDGGESRPGDEGSTASVEEVEKRLNSAFEAFGLSEAERKTAVAGRR